jgi:hypothetical protein
MLTKGSKNLGKQGRIIMKTSDTDVIVLCIYWNNFHNFRISKWTGNVIQISRGH